MRESRDIVRRLQTAKSAVVLVVILLFAYALLAESGTVSLTKIHRHNAAIPTNEAHVVEKIVYDRRILPTTGEILRLRGGEADEDESRNAVPVVDMSVFYRPHATCGDGDCHVCSGNRC